jgi:spermidine synthase
MRRTASSLLAIESPFPEAHCMLRLLEPPDSCRQSLWESLFEGTYGKPFIIDIRLRRFLHFDFDAVQSVMHLAHPDRLCLAYTRKMMAFLLFKRAPERILLLGLGGGSLAKFCYRRLPGAAVTAIEANPDVIALREEFRIPADDDRFRVVRADGAAYVAQLRPCKDVILADACDRTGIAPGFDAAEFYQNARSCLSRGGIFVANVCGDEPTRAAHILKIRNAFGGECMTLRVRPDGNVIVLAFKDGYPEMIDWKHLEAMAVDLKRRLGLDFPKYVRRLAEPLRGREIR